MFNFYGCSAYFLYYIKRTYVRSPQSLVSEDWEPESKRERSNCKREEGKRETRGNEERKQRKEKERMLINYSVKM